eukprot:792162-Rhodomonas_salina.3
MHGVCCCQGYLPIDAPCCNQADLSQLYSYLAHQGSVPPCCPRTWPPASRDSRAARVQSRRARASIATRSASSTARYASPPSRSCAC